MTETKLLTSSLYGKVDFTKFSAGFHTQYYTNTFWITCTRCYHIVFERRLESGSMNVKLFLDAIQRHDAESHPDEK